LRICRNFLSCDSVALAHRAAHVSMRLLQPVNDAKLVIRMFTWENNELTGLSLIKVVLTDCANIFDRVIAAQHASNHPQLTQNLGFDSLQQVVVVELLLFHVVGGMRPFVFFERVGGKLMEVVCQRGIRKTIVWSAIRVDLHNHLLDILVSLGAPIADSSHGVAELPTGERFGLLFFIGTIRYPGLSEGFRLFEIKDVLFG
jgi:hypothetical protein